jgi:hypothetical protein
MKPASTALITIVFINRAMFILFPSQYPRSILGRTSNRTWFVHCWLVSRPLLCSGHDTRVMGRC